VAHFAAQVCAQNSWKPIIFAPEAIEKLSLHAWPGNVRELRNVVERLMLLASEEGVTGETVDLVLPAGGTAGPTSVGAGPLAERVQSFERDVILAELKRAGYQITKAAKTLGLERSHLYKKAEQLGIDIPKQRREES
jgi:two-component system nitrogen regulation response regulator NtrX